MAMQWDLVRGLSSEESEWVSEKYDTGGEGEEMGYGYDFWMVRNRKLGIGIEHPGGAQWVRLPMKVRIREIDEEC